MKVTLIMKTLRSKQGQGACLYVHAVRRMLITRDHVRQTSVNARGKTDPRKNGSLFTRVYRTREENGNHCMPHHCELLKNPSMRYEERLVIRLL